MFARNLMKMRALPMALGKNQMKRAAVQQSLLMNVPKMAFASFDTIEKAGAKLGKALEQEIKYENENYAQVDDIETFLNESGFRFTESDDGLQMTLSKEVGDKSVEIVFEARQPMPDDMPEQEGEEEDEMPSENFCDFTVFIADGSGNKGIVVEATSMDTEIAFNNIVCTNDIKKARNQARFERSFSEYNGPDFTTLDERIQTSMTEYLEGYGVNEHLAAFVECMSLDKDQRLYMRWLSGVKEFIEQ